MNLYNGFILAIASFLLMYSPLQAEERVAHLRVNGNTMMIGPGQMSQNLSFSMDNAQPFQRDQNAGPNATDAELASLTFWVYTKSDVDGLRTTDLAAVKIVNDTLDSHKLDLKNLADSIDALTKRINELEKLLASKK